MPPTLVPPIHPLQRLDRALLDAGVSTHRIVALGNRYHVMFDNAKDSRKGGPVLRGHLTNVMEWVGIQPSADGATGKTTRKAVWHVTGWMI